jgi:hypothetical protein
MEDDGGSESLEDDGNDRGGRSAATWGGRSRRARMAGDLSFRGNRGRPVCVN